MMKILMVCLGNICRSPLAEGILQEKSNQLSLNWTVDSAGTISTHQGELPDSRSIEVAHNHEINITGQRSRLIKISDFETYDLIYVMDESNYLDVLDLAKTEEERDKVKIILNESYPKENRSVPDPYYGGDDGFEIVYQMLDKACTVIIEKLK